MSAVAPAGAAHRGAYVSLSGPTSYPPEELGRYIDAFYLRNKDHFDEGDIAMPLLNLLRETAESEMDPEARKEWAIAAYTRILEKARLNPALSAIAIASTPSLIDKLLLINTPPFYYYSMHDIRYDTGYDNKINPHSIDYAVTYLVRRYSDSLTRDKNPVAFFFDAFTFVCPMLFNNRCPAIRMTIVSKAFEQIYAPPAEAEEAPANAPAPFEEILGPYPRPGAVLRDRFPEFESEQANTYLALCPFLFRAFKRADDFYLRLQAAPNQSSGCCFCTIL